MATAGDCECSHTPAPSFGRQLHFYPCLCVHACPLAGCNFFFCIAALVVAIFTMPLLTYRATEVDLDDVAEWGLKGPGLPTLTDNMAGVYFLSGNLGPVLCSKEEKNDRQICRGRWKISPFLVFDTSYCRYNAAAGKLHCPGGTPWIILSGNPKHKMKPALAKALQLFRISYTINQKDVEFVGVNPTRLSGAMSMYVWGVPITMWARLFTRKNSYRITMSDEGDGSRVTRRTWWNALNTPQPLAAADKEWTYQMKRFYDNKGRVDRAVLNEAKKLTGDTVILLKPSKFGLFSSLGGLLSIFSVGPRMAVA